MSFLFISTHNLATNPRFYKEIILAKRLGHRVTVICFEFKNWSYDYNKELLQSIEDCEVYVIPADRKPVFVWLRSALTERIYRVVDLVFPLRGGYLAQAASRRNVLLVEKIKQLKGPFDRVIGHNPGAIYAAHYAAKKFDCPWGFDVEDYHPGESKVERANRRMKRYMKEHLRFADYLTYASPLIKKETELTVGLKESERSKLVLNYFFSNEFVVPQKHDERDPLKLIWFSQHISWGRGLEEVVPVVESLQGVELHLIGNLDREFAEKHLEGRKNVFLHPPLSQQELHERLSEFDVGIALEPGKDRNNDILLSNKILAYRQSGLYILASTTPSQKDFIGSYPDNGMLTDLTPEALRESLSRLIAGKAKLRKESGMRYHRAKEFCWEVEAEKLERLWEGRGDEVIG